MRRRFRARALARRSRLRLTSAALIVEWAGEFLAIGVGRMGTGIAVVRAGRIHWSATSYRQMPILLEKAVHALVTQADVCKIVIEVHRNIAKASRRNGPWRSGTAQVFLWHPRGMLSDDGERIGSIRAAEPSPAESG